MLDIPSLLTWDGSVRRPNFSDTPFTVEASDTQKGVYAAAQLSLHDNWTLILGNRISSFTVDTPTQSNVTKHSGVNTPYAGLVFDVMDNVSIYTSYTEIFLPQNARNANNERLDPTEGSNIELGVKGDFFNEKLTASVAFYKVEEDNVAANDPNNMDLLPDGTLPAIGIKGAKTNGYEIEVNGKPSDSLTLYWSYTYNDAQQANGAALSPFLPEKMTRLSAIFDVNEQAQVGINVNWQSDISLPSAGPQNQTFEQGSYAVVNVMGSYEINNDWKLNANINNLLDEKYFSSIDFFNQGILLKPISSPLSASISTGVINSLVIGVLPCKKIA